MCWIIPAEFFLLGEAVTVLDYFELSVTLRAICITIRHTPLHCRPITPPLLHSLCALCDKNRHLTMILCLPLPKQLKDWPYMQHMQRQHYIWGARHDHNSEMAQGTTNHRQGSTDTCAPHTRQYVWPTCCLPGHGQGVPSTQANDPLLMLPHVSSHQVVMTGHRWVCFKELLQFIRLDPTLYSLHSLCQGGASTAYHAGHKHYMCTAMACGGAQPSWIT